MEEERIVSVSQGYRVKLKSLVAHEGINMTNKVLGLIGSARRWGNSEVLVREALLGAQKTGASTEMLRLTDLHIEPCTGCMRCAVILSSAPLLSSLPSSGS